jgi:hypothetical protein
VVLTQAEKEAEQNLLIAVKAAEAEKRSAELKAEEEKFQAVKSAEGHKEAAELHADQVVIEAEAAQSAAEKNAAAKKMLADATVAETAAPGLGEMQVRRAEYELIEQKGSAEARVLEMKYGAEAQGTRDKAEAMKILDTVGRDHEEFKLRLVKDKEIELAEIAVRKEIAAQQAAVLGQALSSARVDIIGGESTFFDQLTRAVAGGKAVDRYVGGSKVLSDVKETFFNADPDYFDAQLRRFFRRFGLSPQDFKDLSVSAALTKLVGMTDSADDRSFLYNLLAQAERSGFGGRLIETLGAGVSTPAADGQE